SPCGFPDPPSPGAGGAGPASGSRLYRPRNPLSWNAMTKPTRAAILLVTCLAAAGGSARAQEAPAGIRPLDEFSPVFLGMYRKLMLIEDDIRRHAETYG